MPPQLVDLLDGKLGDVSAAGKHDCLAFEAQTAGLEHLFGKIDGPIARGFRTDEAAAPFEALTSKDTGYLVGDLFVHAKHIADLAFAHTDVASGDVRVGANMAEKLQHKAVAETLHFFIGTATGIKIAAALATTHG